MPYRFPELGRPVIVPPPRTPAALPSRAPAPRKSEPPPRPMPQTVSVASPAELGIRIDLSVPEPGQLGIRLEK